MDADDRRLFETSLHRVAQLHTGPALDAALEEIGWTDALLDDRTAAASVWFAVQGECAVSSSALDDLLLISLRLEADQATAVVLPIGNHQPPATVVDGRLVVRGVSSHRARTAERFVIVLGRGAGHCMLNVSAAELDLQPANGMDPDGGWVRVRGDLPEPSDDAVPTDGWSTAVTVGQLAIATELVAASRAMVTLARNHAVERIQFGQPIASFQAVRHRLADALFAVESADGAVGVGWSESTPFAAAMAKAIAGRSAKTVARHAQQVLAGMGFTTEHQFHRYLRRTLVLDGLLGSGAALSEELGRAVLTSATVPPMLAL